MTQLRHNRTMFNAVLGFFAACLIVILLTSCSPYAAMTEISDTPTAAPSVTVTANLIPSWNEVTATPRPACYVTAYTLNFRSGPGTRYSVKDVLTNGERLGILARRADWLKVITAQDVTGWIYGRYCNG